MLNKKRQSVKCHSGDMNGLKWHTFFSRKWAVGRLGILLGWCGISGSIEDVGRQIIAVAGPAVLHRRAGYGLARLFIGTPAVSCWFVALDSLVLIFLRTLRYVHALGTVLDLIQGRLAVRIAIVGCWGSIGKKQALRFWAIYFIG